MSMVPLCSKVRCPVRYYFFHEAHAQSKRLLLPLAECFPGRGKKTYT